jgi:probable phosphoglycerate mutase
MARLYVIRHGETEWNRDRRVQGHTDVPLSPIGHDQAGAAAESIADAIPHPAAPGRARALLYTSDLTRARETAAPIAARLAVVPRRRADLRERGMGAAEGRTWDELAVAHPAEVDAYRSHADRDAIPDMEPLEAFRARVLQALHDIASVADEDALPAVVVTHGGVLHVVLEEALGRDKKFMIGNATVYKFEVAPGSAIRRV